MLTSRNNAVSQKISNIKSMIDLAQFLNSSCGRNFLKLSRASGAHSDEMLEIEVVKESDDTLHIILFDKNMVNSLIKDSKISHIGGSYPCYPDIKDCEQLLTIMFRINFQVSCINI